ncbi:MAG: dTMP kinase [Chitinophagales bacterium]
MEQHRFIVIEGLDGSGKTTQLSLLRNYLTQANIPFKDLHFPMLNKGYYGRLIASFLRGEFGDLEAVHPQLVALLFAEDRREHIQMVKDWLVEGNLVIADRYVNSNIAFQCAKCATGSSKKALKDWILEFEFEFNQLPKPAFSLFLDVPFAAVKRSLSNTRAGDDRAYLEGKTDIHEANLDFQEQVRQEYLAMVEEQTDFHAVSCYDTTGHFLPPETIHEAIKEQMRRNGLLR